MAMTPQEELALAIEFFKSRAMQAHESDSEQIRNVVFVVPLYEVTAALKLLKQGKFSSYYNHKMKHLNKISKP